MNLINAIATGFFTSLFASGFFYIFLWTLKPNLKICEHIAKEIKPDGSILYRIKVINKTWIYRVIDVKASFQLVESYQVSGGTNYRLNQIKLKRSELWYISRRYFSDVKGDFAQIFLLTMI